MDITITNILLITTLIGVIFSAYLHFRKPQEKLELSQLVTEKEIANKATILAQQEMESKATLLANQVEWEKNTNKEKFIEYGRKLDEVMINSQKEVVKIDHKLDSFIHTQSMRNEEYSNQFTKLFTLLDERLPRPKR